MARAWSTQVSATSTPAGSIAPRQKSTRAIQKTDALTYKIYHRTTILPKQRREQHDRPRLQHGYLANVSIVKSQLRRDKHRICLVLGGPICLVPIGPICFVPSEPIFPVPSGPLDLRCPGGNHDHSRGGYLDSVLPA